MPTAGDARTPTRDALLRTVALGHRVIDASTDARAAERVALVAQMSEVLGALAVLARQLAVESRPPGEAR